MIEVKDPIMAEFQNRIVVALEGSCNTASFRGGYYSFFQINQLLDLAKSYPDMIVGKRVIDFGCGATRPVTAAILLYLLGANSTLAIDLETPTDIGSIAVANYSNILTVLSGLSTINWANAPVPLKVAQRRAGEFNMAALLRGELQAGLAPAIAYEIGKYQDLSFDNRKFDLMISYSVFEHVSDIEDLMTSVRYAISSNGYIFTSVDYRDHRLYSQNMNQWQYLMDDGDHAPGYINKMRYSAMAEMFIRSGFKIEQVNVVQQKPPAGILDAILPKYRTMSETDLHTVEAQFLLRPVASTIAL